MTVPNGPDGINHDNGIFLVSGGGYGDQRISELPNNVEDVVKGKLIEKFIGKGGGSLFNPSDSVFTDPNGPLAKAWSGLRQGIPLPFAIVELIAKRLLHLPDDFTFDTFDEALAGLGQIPEIGGDIAKAVAEALEHAALDARNLFGSIDPALLQLVPVSSITDTSPNLINGGFDTPTTGVDLGHQGWNYVSTDGHTTPGCWQVAPDGASWKTFEHNPIPVTPGQTLPMTARAKWIGTTAAPMSNGVQLNVRCYRANAFNNLILVSTITVAAVTPSGSSISVDPNDHDFLLLAGAFTVPANVDAVSELFAVAPTVSGGLVRFDEGTQSKTSLLPDFLVDGLASNLTVIRDRIQATIDSTVQGLLDVVTHNHTTDELKAALANFPRLTSLFDVLGNAPGSGVPAIAQRLAALSNNGTVDAAALFNLIGLPPIPNGLAKIGDLQAVNDNLTNALSGNSLTGSLFSGTGLGAARATLESLFAQLSTTTRRVQALETVQTAAAVGGAQQTVNFANYPDGPFPAGLFTMVYFGSGSSRLAISGGRAVWNLVNDGDVRVLMRYPAPTLTDYQVVRGAMASPPEYSSSGQRPRIWAAARMNAAGTDFVFARGYCTGFLTYRCDIGCVKGGVEYVWQPNVPLTWALDMRLIAGVGTTSRRWQVLSGETIVVDYLETPSQPGGLSIDDPDHLYWGSCSETNGVNTSGAVAGSSVVDNAPPAVVGTTFRATRRTGADLSIGALGVKLPNNFYETVDYISPDLTYTPNQNCRVTFTKQGTYLVEYRVLHGKYFQNSGGHGLLYKNGSPYARGSWGDTPTGLTAIASNIDATTFSTMVPMNPGEYLEPGMHFTQAMSNTGDPDKMADGSQSWFAITRVGVT